jgi:L-histidine N-alpha-methyltransferase
VLASLLELEHHKFAEEVRRGLTQQRQKTLPTRFLYDDLGSALFDAITALPEYGLTRADVRLLHRLAPSLSSLCPNVTEVVELGSGNGSKTPAVLSAFGSVRYRPVDLSRAALESCRQVLHRFDTEPIEAEFIPGLREAASMRAGDGGILVLFLGSNIGNFERSEVPDFLTKIRSALRPDDALLLGADLVKPIDQLLLAYDDPTGVSAAFNRNLLARVNRTFGANFDVRCYNHEAIWNQQQRRIEMHLRPHTDQRVRIKALDVDITIRHTETIHTESSHKFVLDELLEVALTSGFTAVDWVVDDEWPFAEILFRAV